MKNLFLTVFIFLYGLSLFATDGYFFRNLTVEQGLTSNTINCIHKDNKNFIWLGTANGLNRFDGTAILSFEEFKDKSIISIIEPDTTNLYILSERELYKYNRLTRKNIRLSFINDDIPFFKKLALDKNNNIYIVSNKGLYLLEKNSLTASPVRNSSLEKKVITDIYIDNKNNCWLTTLEGLIKYNPESDQTLIFENLRTINYYV